MKNGALKTRLSEYAAYSRQGIAHYIPDKEPKKYLYDLVSDYPNREAKGLRPAMLIAVGRAHGARLEQLINSATAIELLHNAFLIHDDIEDDSYMRRNKPTMHQYNNVGIAINVGDAMNALGLAPLLHNCDILGYRLACKIFLEFQHMVTESVEGQAMELGWRKDNSCDLQDTDYLRMILKKTCWYTCIHPIRIGAIIGTQGKINPERFDRLGYCMGTAFQIQDDLLNLVGDGDKYGKEIAGDIIEGKRTLMLIHLFGKCNKREYQRLHTFLSEKNKDSREEHAPWVLERMHHYGSIDYARNISKYMAGAALKEFHSVFSCLPDSEDKAFMQDLISYMITRDY